MAFQTGSQINPALGAINYTPYLQGSMAGSQAIGQGIANLGQGIASGIEQYQKQKKENQAIEAEIKSNRTTMESFGNIVKTLPQQYQDGYAGILSKLNDPNLSRVEQQALSKGALDYLGKAITLGLPEVERERAITEKNNIAASENALMNEGMGPVPLSKRASMLISQGIEPYQVAEAQKRVASRLADEAKVKSYAAETELTKAKTGAVAQTNQYSGLLANAINQNRDYVTGAINYEGVMQTALKNNVPIDDVNRYIATVTSAQPKPPTDTAEIKNIQFKNERVKEYQKLLKKDPQAAYFYSIENDLGFVGRDTFTGAYPTFDQWLSTQSFSGEASASVPAAPAASKAPALKLPSGVTYKSTTK
jgi:hypothetical protein